MPHLVWGRSQCPRFLRTLRGLSRRRAPAIRVRQRTSSRCRRGVRAARDPSKRATSFRTLNASCWGGQESHGCAGPGTLWWDAQDATNVEVTMRRCAKGDRNGRGNRGGSPRPDSARARCGSGAASDGLGRRGLDGPIGTGSRRPAGRVFLVPETWEGSRGAPARRGPLAFPGATGHADEARDWLAKSLAAPGAEARTVTRARALYGAGILAFRKLDADAARRSFEECLAIAKERDYVRLIVRANTGMARLALRRGDTKEVRKWSEAGLAIARARGEKSDAATP